ncbi:MAG: hypothetical protein KAQ79_05480 [Cyclobacteriaceae bacterium]|nr:hypothetical protein [Cyclobacteriaceae bacterium]
MDKDNRELDNLPPRERSIFAGMIEQLSFRKKDVDNRYLKEACILIVQFGVI